MSVVANASISPSIANAKIAQQIRQLLGNNAPDLQMFVEVNIVLEEIYVSLSWTRARGEKSIAEVQPIADKLQRYFDLGIHLDKDLVLAKRTLSRASAFIIPAR